MIDQSTIGRIFDAAQIVDVVEDFIPLRKRGVNYLGLCPFHQEKTPSFTVSPAKGIYKCFGCGKGGNPVNFIMDHESLNYVDALKYLAKKYHIEVEETQMTDEQLEQKNTRESLMIVSGFAQEYFTDQLLNDERGKAIGKAYFVERGIREDMIERFQLGYCQDKKDAFTQAAKSKGYKMEYLTQSGLTIQKEDWIVDRFNARVMFPIHNLTGRVIAFGGRTLSSDKKTAKYLNSPESEIYQKSKVLYGIYQAKRSIVQNERCYLVEGYTDVISMHQAGIENVVASSGTALTADQIRLIKRFTENITILYDGDAAGIKASLRGIDLILEEGMNVRVVLFPDGEDPDSYSRSHSSSEVLEFLKEKEKDFILFKTDLLSEEAKNDPVKKGNMIRDIVRSVAIIPDRIKRAVFIRECARILEMDEEMLYSEVGKILRQKSGDQQKRDGYRYEPKPSAPKQVQQSPAEKDLTEHFEKELIRLMVKYGNNVLLQIEEEGEKRDYTVVDMILADLENEQMLQLQTPYLRLVYDLVKEQVIDTGCMQVKDLVNHHDQTVSGLIADFLSKEYSLSDLWSKKDNFVETEEHKLEELVPETILALKQHRIQILLKEKMDLLKNDMSDDEIMDTMKLIQQLNLMNQEISTKLGERTII